MISDYIRSITRYASTDRIAIYNLSKFCIFKLNLIQIVKISKTQNQAVRQNPQLQPSKLICHAN